ncbi:tissue factor pathway inhibitor-like [Notothenia coriiceps]|uniref:Tissue factor pathway inhibitor-like n=1 Tax=Notothenia coriiceps TaxID=8208 RepID=A0A6I9MC51_9TELE|nr:PREDICTED: tissue factor pathway inhibitor-like [Notothenia coriiceps]
MSQQCKHLFYGGCFGNANNFRSMADCQAKCQNPAEPTEPPEGHIMSARRSDIVQPTRITGESTVAEPQVQANVTNPEPKEVKPTDLCLSPVERGTCDGAEKRFAFNSKTNRCHAFHYSGCEGNENNFQSRKDCIIKCIKRRKAHGRGTIRIRKKNLNSIVNRSV